MSAWPRPIMSRANDVAHERDRWKAKYERGEREKETLLRQLDDERTVNADLEVRLSESAQTIAKHRGGPVLPRPAPAAGEPPRGDHVAYVRRAELVQAGHRIHQLERALAEHKIALPATVVTWPSEIPEVTG